MQQLRNNSTAGRGVTTAKHEGADELLETGVLSEQPLVAWCLFLDKRPRLQKFLFGDTVCQQVLPFHSHVVSGVSVMSPLRFDFCSHSRRMSRQVNKLTFKTCHFIFSLFLKMRVQLSNCLLEVFGFNCSTAIVFCIMSLSGMWRLLLSLWALFQQLARFCSKPLDVSACRQPNYAFTVSKTDQCGRYNCKKLWSH